MNDVNVTDNQIIANEFNNVYVSICQKLASDISSNVNPLAHVKVLLTVLPSRQLQHEKGGICSAIKNSSPG